MTAKSYAWPFRIDRGSPQNIVKQLHKILENHRRPCASFAIATLRCEREVRARPCGDSPESCATVHYVFCGDPRSIREWARVTTLPSFVGFSPQAEVRMALSMSGHRARIPRETTIIVGSGSSRCELIHRHGRAMIIHANAYRAERYSHARCAASLNPCGMSTAFSMRVLPQPSRPWLMQSSSYLILKAASRPYAGVTVDPHARRAPRA